MKMCLVHWTDRCRWCKVQSPITTVVTHNLALLLDQQLSGDGRENKNQHLSSTAADHLFNQNQIYIHTKRGQKGAACLLSLYLKRACLIQRYGKAVPWVEAAGSSQKWRRNYCVGWLCLSVPGEAAGKRLGTPCAQREIDACMQHLLQSVWSVLWEIVSWLSFRKQSCQKQKVKWEACFHACKV